MKVRFLGRGPGGELRVQSRRKLTRGAPLSLFIPQYLLPFLGLPEEGVIEYTLEVSPRGRELMIRFEGAGHDT